MKTQVNAILHKWQQGLNEKKNLLFFNIPTEPMTERVPICNENIKSLILKILFFILSSSCFHQCLFRILTVLNARFDYQ